MPLLHAKYYGRNCWEYRIECGPAVAYQLESGEMESSNRPEITLKLVRMIRSIKEYPLGADPHHRGNQGRLPTRRFGVDVIGDTRVGRNKGSKAQVQ